MSDAKDRRDKMRARRGTRVATTTEVIGDGEVGDGARLKMRDSVARKTSAGDAILMMKTASGILWPAIVVGTVFVIA